jgi:hypothetical protein
MGFPKEHERGPIDVAHAAGQKVRFLIFGIAYLLYLGACIMYIQHFDSAVLISVSYFETGMPSCPVPFYSTAHRIVVLLARVSDAANDALHSSCMILSMLRLLTSSQFVWHTIMYYQSTSPSMLLEPRAEQAHSHIAQVTGTQMAAARQPLGRSTRGGR